MRFISIYKVETSPEQLGGTKVWLGTGQTDVPAFKAQAAAQGPETTQHLGNLSKSEYQWGARHEPCRLREGWFSWAVTWDLLLRGVGSLSKEGQTGHVEDLPSSHSEDELEKTRLKL